MSDSDLAKDMAEESFIKAWEKYDKFESEENAKAFVYIVAKNKCINQLAAIKRHFTQSIDLDIFEELLLDKPIYDFDIIEAEVITFIKEQIETLPPARRESIKLFMKGLDWHEVGKQLGCSPKTALNQKRTAVKYLRNLVKLKFDI